MLRPRFSALGIAPEAAGLPGVGGPSRPHIRGEGDGCWQGEVPIPPALPQLIITLGNCMSGRAGSPRGLACRCGASRRPGGLWTGAESF